MKHTIIAPISENIQAVYVGIKEFPTAKLIILSSPDYEQTTAVLTKDLEKFCVPYTVHSFTNNGWETIFHTIRDIALKEQSSPLLINVGAADPSAKCAATCAGFVNGIKAFDVMNNEIMMLPVLKFSYYSLLTEKKLALLRILAAAGEQGCGLEMLAKKAKISAPLLSYHIHGTPKVEGLKQLGLIDIFEKDGKILIKINMLGNMLMKGYIKS